MIKDITLTINGRVFGDRLSQYSVEKEVSYGYVYQTLSGREIPVLKKVRPIIRFSLLPYTNAVSSADFEALNASSLSVSYTDPDTGAVETRDMMLDSSIGHAFGINSIDGNVYYKGDEIVLRSLTVM